MSKTTVDLEMKRVIPLASKRPDKETVEKITSLSADNVKRNYSEYVVQLSPKREGMAMENVLKIASGKATA